MIRTKNELLEAVRNMLTDSTTDEALALLEDVSDTLDNAEDRESENWKEKYEELDKSWREKYRDRFFSGGKDDDRSDDDKFFDPEPPEKRSFDELFTVAK